MTDISKVTFNSNEYDIKDTVARNQMVQLTAAEYEEIPDSVKNSDNKLYLVEDEAYTYPIDAAPTANSDHLVASGGVYTALAEANAKIDDNADNISAINGGQLSKSFILVQNDMASVISTYGNGAYAAWGTFGGLFGGWAWGLLLISDGTANFIGIRNATKTIAAGHYENGTWTKVTSIDS